MLFSITTPTAKNDQLGRVNTKAAAKGECTGRLFEGCLQAWRNASVPSR